MLASDSTENWPKNSEFFNGDDYFTFDTAKNFLNNRIN